MSTDAIPERLLSVRRAAARLDISPRQLYRMIQRGELGAVQLGQRMMRIPASEVDRLVSGKPQGGES